ncbi:MAG: hypothetical protein F4X65_07370 [Chloroflexi bacterium]|nr:hypothetical protein [Chloroflexota bacterium]
MTANRNIGELDDVVHQLEQDNRELKAQVSLLQKQVRQRELDSAYIYIHSNWLWIRWFLTRDQDRSGEDSDLLRRARAAEASIRDNLPRNLRAVQFDPEPMQVAYRWRIETTVTLNRHGYTFFD